MSKKALQNEVEALRKCLGALRRELEEIKILLRARAAPLAAVPSNVVLTIKD